MMYEYVRKILNSPVYQVAEETPLMKAHFLSKRLENHILIKREDLQSVFSFKIRGAFNRMATMSADEKARGVVAASAGNHAQGIALSAKKLGINAKIVMPQTTPSIKVQSVIERGGEVVLFGDNFGQALKEALRIQELEQRVFVHPYDDPDVIAGQGTIGMELIRQTSESLDAVFVPVGGGGLLAGIVTYIKYVRPEVKVIGVESEESACLKAAMSAGKPVKLESVGIFADGVAVDQIGTEPFRLIKDSVDEVIVVNNDEVCAAIKDIFEDMRTIAEPSGAVALAGLKKYVENHRIKGQTLIPILSGANVDFRRLRFISERADVGEHREALFSVCIPEVKGSFLQFVSTLKGHNITEFNYRYATFDHADVFLGVQLKNGFSERMVIVKKLENAGYATRDLTEDDLSKEHIRNLVGGHLASQISNERIYQIEFPERGGALLNFLEKMNNRWNMSLFHYRNRGGVIGRVLIGFNIPENEISEFQCFLNQFEYTYRCFSDHPAYHQFLM